MKTLVLGVYRTPFFTFRALAPTKSAALAALANGFETHRRMTGSDTTFNPRACEFDPYQVGACYRNDSRITEGTTS